MAFWYFYNVMNIIAKYVVHSHSNKLTSQQHTLKLIKEPLLQYELNKIAFALYLHFTCDMWRAIQPAVSRISIWRVTQMLKGLYLHHLWWMYRVKGLLLTFCFDACDTGRTIWYGIKLHLYNCISELCKDIPTRIIINNDVNIQMPLLFWAKVSLRLQRKSGRVTANQVRSNFSTTCRNC